MFNDQVYKRLQSLSLIVCVLHLWSIEKNWLTYLVKNKSLLSVFDVVLIN